MWYNLFVINYTEYDNKIQDLEKKQDNGSAEKIKSELKKKFDDYSYNLFFEFVGDFDGYKNGRFTTCYIFFYRQIFSVGKALGQKKFSDSLFFCHYGRIAGFNK